MPHVSEFHATGDHDRHDVLLVAALAAGDLSGIDRDHALDLTRSCASCADLHDDLVAIAGATASVPPPITERPRDFQLTAADAARLRPAGWRGFLGSLTGARSLASRPLGIGLATLGLAGLLIGNAPVFSLGGSAATPTSAAASAGGASMPEAAGGARPADSAAAASGAPAYVQAPPGASSTEFGTSVSGGASPSAAPSAAQDHNQNPAPAASGIPGRTSYGDGVVKSEATPDAIASAGTPDAPASDASPFRPLNLVFGLAVILGLGVLVASRFRSRPTA